MMGPLSSPSGVGKVHPCRRRCQPWVGRISAGRRDPHRNPGRCGGHFLRASGEILPRTTFHPCWLKSARHHMLRSRRGDSGSLTERPHLFLGPFSEPGRLRAAQTSQARDGDAVL